MNDDPPCFLRCVNERSKTKRRNDSRVATCTKDVLSKTGQRERLVRIMGAVVLYHGMTLDIAAKVATVDHIRPSTHGELGPGVYLGGFEKAKMFASIAGKRGNGVLQRGVVLKLQVNLGRCKELTTNYDKAGRWRGEGYDSVHRRTLVPTWAG